MISIYSETAELITALEALPEDKAKEVRNEVSSTLSRIRNQVQQGLLTATDLAGCRDANFRHFYILAENEEKNLHAMIEAALLYNGLEALVAMRYAMAEAERQAAIVTQRIINKM